MTIRLSAAVALFMLAMPLAAQDFSGLKEPINPDRPDFTNGPLLVDPGHLQIELTIFAADGKRLDSDYRNMSVPDLHVTRPTFATIQVIRTRNAREFALSIISKFVEAH